MKSFLWKLPKLGYGNRINPMRDWLILLAFSLLLLIVSGVWNAWFYQDVVAKSNTSVTASTTASSSNPLLLTEVQNIFASRATEEAKYEDGTYTFIDPSQ